MADIYPYLKQLKNKHILGINPPVFDFAYFDLWAKPLGLLYILQWLRDEGNSVELIDCIFEARERSKDFGRYKIRRRRTEKPLVYSEIPRKYWHFGLDQQEFLSRLENVKKPDVILLTSTMTYWYGGVLWCIEQIRKVFPHVPVILGGIYVRLCPEHAELSGADHLQTEFMPVEAKRPATDLYASPGYAIVETSWGCPMGCDYCASKLLCPEFIQRSPQEVIEEIRSQVDGTDITDIAIYDDALLINKDDHFYPICEKIQKEFGHLRFHTPNGLHVRQIDEKCAKCLYDTGFKTIRLSLESVDPEVQKESSSKVSREQYRSGVEHLLKAGYGQNDLETYVLVGLPGQNIQGIRDTISFVKDLGARVKIAQFSPIPGTSLYYEALKKVPELSNEPLLQNNTVYSTWISRELTPEELQELKDMARS